MPDTLVKKLTIKALRVKERPKKDGPPIHVGRLVGTCSGETRAVTTQYGITQEFKGMFAGISMIPDPETGEIIEHRVRSDKLFVPSLFEAVLLNAIGEEKKQVDFAADVFIEYRMIAGNDGVEYSVKPLFEEKAASNPLTALLASLPAMPGSKNKAQLSLVEAPVEAAAPVDAAAAAPAEAAVPAEAAPVEPVKAKNKR